MKSILNLEGVKKLNRENLKSITGKAAAFCVCDGPRISTPSPHSICINCIDVG